MKKQKTNGWGTKTTSGEEMWDDLPLFKNEVITKFDWFKLFFYPKKFYLYRWALKYVKRNHKKSKIKIVDIGSGTGGTVIDFKKIFGRRVEIIGVDVINEQVELSKKRMKKFGVWSEFHLYDGENLPFSDKSIDIIYSSDVLGHVQDVPLWLKELNRVLKPNGEILMFSESKLGKHAYIRNYLMTKGINTDPHAEFHISLYSKKQLKELFVNNGLIIKTMLSIFWMAFFAHPEEMHSIIQKQKGIFVIKLINKVLFFIKNLTKPVSLAVAEFYGLIEMTILGRFIESQGYIIRAVKELETVEYDEPERIERFTPLAVEYTAREEI